MLSVAEFCSRAFGRGVLFACFQWWSSVRPTFGRGVLFSLLSVAEFCSRAFGGGVLFAYFRSRSSVRALSVAICDRK